MADAKNASVAVLLPQDLPNWSAMESVLRELACPQSDIPQALSLMAELFTAFTSRPSPVPLKKTPFLRLKWFMENVADEEEQASFLTVTLPTIARLGLDAKRLRPPEGLHYVRQLNPEKVTLDRKFVASLVAVGFLCLFPDRESLDIDGPSATFDHFFHFLQEPFQQHKLRCILNYFRRVSTSEDFQLPGSLTFHRVVLRPDQELTIESLVECRKSLCPLVVKTEGLLEDAGCGVLQTDFANEYLGGGVLQTGRVQEEIRFTVCPELLASMAFQEVLAPQEACVIQGFEQFSQYSGYADTFTYEGDCTDPSGRDSAGNLLNSIVAIDAVPYAFGSGVQYKQEHILRDVNKAYVGFLQPYAQRSPSHGSETLGHGALKNLDPEAVRPVATGNWGCGAFGGDAQLKSMLQWVAASMAGCPAVLYYTFRQSDVADLDAVATWIREDQGWDVGKLVSALLKGCEQVWEERASEDCPAIFETLKNP